MLVVVVAVHHVVDVELVRPDRHLLLRRAAPHLQHPVAHLNFPPQNWRIEIPTTRLPGVLLQLVAVLAHLLGHVLRDVDVGPAQLKGEWVFSVDNFLP